MRFSFLHTMLLLVSMTAQAQQQGRTVEYTYAFDPDGEVVIENYKGGVIVRPWSRDEIHVVARIEADPPDRASSLLDVGILVTGTTESVEVETDYRKILGNLEATSAGEYAGLLPLVHYTIHVPHTAHVRIDDYMSEIDVADMIATVNVFTYKGDIRVHNVEGPLRLDTFSGNISVRLTRFTRGISIESYQGTISVVLPRNTGFNLSMRVGKTGRATIAADATFAALSPNSSSYAGPINGGGPTLALSTELGSLRLDTW